MELAQRSIVTVYCVELCVLTMVSPGAEGFAEDFSTLKQVNVASTFTEFRNCIQQTTPGVYTKEPVYSFQNMLNESWLRENVGKSQVGLRKSPSGKFVDPSDGILTIAKALRSKEVSLEEFLDNKEPRTLLSGTDTYIFTKDAVVEQWSELWTYAREVLHEHGNDKSLISQSMLSTVGFWLSRSGIQSMTHYDDSLDKNLNFQVKGKKEILMFPPGDWKHLKTFKAMSLHPFSFFDGIKQGTSNSARQRNCRPQFVELNEGDILFIPSGWFHFVEHIDDLNINMTYWFKNDVSKKEMNRPKQSLRNILIPLKLSVAFFLSYFSS